MNSIHTAYPEKLPPQLLADISLLQYSAHNRAVGVTGAEALAWMAGDPHSENPPSVCPVLLAAIRFWGRNLSQASRNTLLIPLLPNLLHTGSDSTTSTQRAHLFMVWTIMTNTSAWLDAAGRHSDALSLRNTPYTNLFRVHKALDAVLANSPRNLQKQPSQGPTRAVLASGHFMPERYRTLQQKAQTSALIGAITARQQGRKLSPLVRQLQASFAQHILSTAAHHRVT